MIIGQIMGQEPLNEVNIADKIAKDPSRSRMLVVAWRHDNTLPPTEVAKLGPKPDEKAVAQEWSDMLEQTLARTNYGDLSRDFKFADWLTKLYTSGAADWEDISGEGGDALGAWHALSQRGLLDKRHQDLNNYKTLKSLQLAVMQNQRYSAELQRIKNAAEIAKMKKDKKDLVIMDTDRFWVAIPFNYGACYVFNNTGHISNFCTGGSSGMRWFNNYAPDGVMVMIVDKNNVDKEDGKWQMHAATNQLVNSVQDHRYDNGEYFGKLFPGLMLKILAALKSHAVDIQTQSEEISARKGGYDMAREISLIKDKFGKSLTKAPNEPDEPEPEETAAEETAAPTENTQALTVAEDYRQYLAPEYRNLIDPGNQRARRLRIVRNDRAALVAEVRNVNQLFALVARSRPDWLQPGSIIRTGKAPRNA